MPPLTLLLAAILGLIIGSFLNAVIYRLPFTLNSNKNITLLHPPRSFCPHCKQTLHPLELIPILSFLWQKGKCTHCQTPISRQYPLIELTTTLITLLIIIEFGLTTKSALYLLLAYHLIPLFIIDAQQQLLPDLLTIPLLWIGLIYQMQFGNLPAAVIGAIAGYLSLWILYWLFKLLRNKEALGYGDFKLTAALTAWIGWQQLPYLLTLASILSILYFLLLTNRNPTQTLPFGPFLITAFTLLQLFS